MASSNSQEDQSTERKDFVESRKAPRFDASAIPSLKSVHLVEEAEVKLINISRSGALIEAQERMAPGSNVSLRVVTKETEYILKGKIIRCYVYTIGEVLTYQSAVEFYEDFTLMPSGEEVI